MPEGTTTNKVVQLKDPTTKEPVSPVVNVGSIYDKNGNKVDNLLTYTVAGTNVPIPEIKDIASELQQQVDGKLAEVDTAVDNMESQVDEFLTNPGLPVHDVRTYPVRSGQSISAGDVVNVGAASEGEPETVYKDVVAQDNVENVIESTATTATAICKLNEEYSVAAFVFQGTEFHIALIRNSDGKYANAYASITAQNVSSVSLARLDDSHFAMSFSEENGIVTKVYTLSGTSITQAASYTGLYSDNDTEECVAIDSSRCLVISGGIDGGKGLPTYVCTFSGSDLAQSAISVCEDVPNTTNYISATRIPDDSSGNKRVCICFSDTGDGNKGKAVIATIDSSNAVTFGDVKTMRESSLVGSGTSICVVDDKLIIALGTYLYTCNFDLSYISDYITPSIGNTFGGATLISDSSSAIVLVRSSHGRYAKRLTLSDYDIHLGDEYKFNNGTSSSNAYFSGTSIYENSFLIAYADITNSSYGTTTILTVEGNRVAGSFLGQSNMAIALESGTGGETIKLGYGGYCECPGVAADDEIVGSGEDAVSAIAPKPGWLWINPAHTYDATVREPIDVPTVSGTLTYSGQAQSPTWNGYDADKMTIGGNTSATNAGEYTATFTPKEGYRWSDGPLETKSVQWSIAKATPTLSLNPTSLSLVGPTPKTSTITYNGDGELSAQSNSSSIATASVSGTTLSVTAAGTGSTTITVMATAGTNYNSASTSLSVSAVCGISFATDSWATIAAMSEAGVASQVYSLGDTKNITLSGIGTMTLEIADFDHDYLSASTSAQKAGISIITKDLLYETYKMNSSNTNAGGFPATTLKNTLNTTIFNALPSDLQSVIKTIYKWYGKGNATTNGAWQGFKIWIPLEYELFGETTYSPATEHTTGNARKYPIFTDNASRIKHMRNGSSVASWYWEASPAGEATHFCCVGSNGGVADYYANASTNGVCFGLCV